MMTDGPAAKRPPHWELLDTMAALSGLEWPRRGLLLAAAGTLARRCPGRAKPAPPGPSAGLREDGPKPLPEFSFTDAEGQERRGRRLRRHRAADQPLGDLVRALRRGDAGARPRPGGAAGGRDPGAGAVLRPGRQGGGGALPARGDHPARPLARPARGGRAGDGRARPADHGGGGPAGPGDGAAGRRGGLGHAGDAGASPANWSARPRPRRRTSDKT